MIDFNDTYQLIDLVEQAPRPANFLVDAFFGRRAPISQTKTVMMEYLESGRALAPYIVPGSSGINLSRAGSTIRAFTPPMVAPKRVITIEDIERRGLGENPTASKAAAQRANEIQARDVGELIGAIQNRKNQMASEILTTGKLTIRGLADDGRLVTVEPVDFGWRGKFQPATSWADPSSDPYADIEKMSEWVQEKTGEIPTVMVIGRKVRDYLLSNKKILKDWLSIPSRENFALMSIQPRLVSPQIQRVGIIQMLNLEIYCYSQSYQDELGQTKAFFPENGVLIAKPDLGIQLHGAVTVLNDKIGSFETYASEMVPVYRSNFASQAMELTMYSRFILVPTIRDGFAYMDATDVASDGGSEGNESLPGLDG